MPGAVPHRIHQDLDPAFIRDRVARVTVYLETPRMILRELTFDDAAHLQELDSDPEVMRYLTNGIASTPEFIRTALERTQKLYEKHAGRYGFWAAIEKTSGVFMGWFLFRPSKSEPDDTKRIEVGYRFMKRHWGQGYAPEGSRALIAKGFAEYPIDEIFAVTMKANAPSRRVMEKIGLIYRREYESLDFPVKGEREVEYSVTRAEWMASLRA